MKIARVSSEQKGETDRLLSEVAGHLETNGKALVGIVKEMSYDSQFENGCDMKVRVLPAGEIIQITQNLGAGSNACRLDPGAIATAVAKVEQTTLEDADFFILNKFGPEEAAGRGFCNVIGAAVEKGIPVLVGVGTGTIDAFDAFSGGLATPIEADLDTILNWCDTAQKGD